MAAGINSPAGTAARPPPALLQASIARRNASVQSALPSGLAPKRVMSKERSGNEGVLMRCIMSRYCVQGSSAAKAKRPSAAAAAVFRKVRRGVTDLSTLISFHMAGIGKHGPLYEKQFSDGYRRNGAGPFCSG